MCFCNIKTRLRHIERETESVLLRANGRVLEETMKIVKNQAPVDTF